MLKLQSPPIKFNPIISFEEHRRRLMPELPDPMTVAIRLEGVYELDMLTETEWLSLPASERERFTENHGFYLGLKWVREFTNAEINAGLDPRTREILCKHLTDFEKAEFGLLD